MIILLTKVVLVISELCGERLAHTFTGVDAAAEERALERVLAVHTTATEACDLARGIEAYQGFPG